VNGIEVSGVLCLDKPDGMTSHDAVNKIRRLFSTKKVGHTGTLDPLATGVLPILVGRAAKAAEYLSADAKSYSAVLTLGITTDTEDISGEVITSSDNIPSEDDVIRAAESFLGRGSQIPPMYSALKVDGRKLCDLARRGIEIERQPREIEITAISAKKIGEREYSLDVTCSKGTYIRTLCADIGKKLGCGGVMSALRRTASGGFDISRSVTFEQLENMSFEERCALLLPTEELFADLPAVTLPDFYAKLAHSGAEIYQKKIKTSFPEGTRVRFYDKNGFFAVAAVAEFPDGSAIKPQKQFVTD